MTGKGWATGSDIRSRPYTHIPQEDWDAIFKKDKQESSEPEQEQEPKGRFPRIELNGNRLTN